MGDIPVLSLRLTIEFRRDRGRWVNLQARLFLAVEPFNQNRKGLIGWPAFTQNAFRILTDEFTYGFALTRCGLSFGAVDDFPALADDFAFRQFAIEMSGKPSATPDAFLIDG